MSFLLFFYDSRLPAFRSMARSHQKDSDPNVLSHFWSFRPPHTSTSSQLARPPWGHSESCGKVASAPCLGRTEELGPEQPGPGAQRLSALACRGSRPGLGSIESEACCGDRGSEGLWPAPERGSELEAPQSLHFPGSRSSVPHYPLPDPQKGDTEQSSLLSSSIWAPTSSLLGLVLERAWNELSRGLLGVSCQQPAGGRSWASG